MLLLQRTCTRRRLPVAPIRCIHHDSAKQEPIKLHRMVNVYMYNKLSAIEEIKDNLLLTWHKQLGVTGRVYLHPEGINAQLAVPEARVKAFMRKVKSYPIFKRAEMFEGDLIDTSDPQNAPFKSLHVRLRPLVLDGFAVNELDMSKTGTALTPDQWHEVVKTSEDTEILDCRNYYESEVGLFDGAHRLPIAKHLDSFDEIDKHLEQFDKDKKILIYCTGGIRCEKIGAYLTQKAGYKNVNRLHGGINNYVKYVRENGLVDETVFKGKNWVFDQRLATNDKSTRVSEHVLSNCQICNTPVDDVYNCDNKMCNLLYIACPACRDKLSGCCSTECKDVKELPPSVYKEVTAQYVAKKRAGFEFEARSKSVLGIQGRKSLPSYTEEDRIGSGPPEDERVTTKASGPKVGEINQASAPVTNSTPIYTTTTTRKTTTKADPQTPSEKTTVTTTVNTSTVKAGITTTTATTTTTTTPVINSEDVLEYAFDHTSEQPEPVRKIEDWTNEEMPKRAHNIVGPLVAQFIRTLIRTSGAKSALELGTFSGYSASVIASALPENGYVVTCESDVGIAEVAKKNLRRHNIYRYKDAHKDGYADCEGESEADTETKDEAADEEKKVWVRIGDAMETLKKLKDEESSFDFIFIDADKKRYIDYYRYIIDNKLLNKDGILLIDNVLWKGKVVFSSTIAETDSHVSANNTPDKKTQSLIDFNKFVKNDARTEKVMLPIRDGLFLITWAEKNQISAE